MNRYSWIWILLVAAAACNNGDTRPHQANISGYRDIKGYFIKELSLIRQQKPVLFKTVTLNEQRDSTTINTPDSAQLHDLLQPFLETDLNKPSLQDAYDTIRLADQFTGKQSLLYKAKDKSTPLQEVILNIDNNQQIQSVQLNKQVDNLVYEYQQHLEYEHNNHIRIITRQKIAFLPSRELDVKVMLR